MTIRITETPVPVTDGTLIYLFEFLDFMRTASPTGPGWVISRSSNGTVGGAGDNITVFSDLSQYVATTSESWFVLQQPDGAREFLWFRTTPSDALWNLSYSPTAAYTGGDAGNPPTAVDAKVVHSSDTIMTSGNNALHIGADDAAPYGWYVYVNLSGNFSDPQAAMAMIPITDAVQPGDTDAIVFYYDGGNGGYTQVLLESESTTTTVGRCAGITPGASSWDAIPALSVRAGANTVFPNGSAQNTVSEDLSAPIHFSRRAALPAPQGDKGFTDFMQWNGVTRAPGETFSSLARVSWGVVNFPWDGATTPSVTG
jgi:hypothetical protein